MLYIGMMSGTSTDGVDAVIVSFLDYAVKLFGTIHEPYPETIKEAIFALYHQKASDFVTLGELHTRLGEFYAQVIKTMLVKTGVKAEKIVAIGNHGQTIFHHPKMPYPFTLQIGNAHVLAARTGIPVVSDFRGMDMAYGGQGAPLVPLFHEACFAKKGQNVAVVNIGGMSNVTFIESNGKISGYDTGPGNILLDLWCYRHQQTPFDKGGAFARSGKAHLPLLSKMLAFPYFQEPSPKSTGREVFDEAWLTGMLTEFGALPPEDVQATLTELTTRTIANAIKSAKAPVDLVYLCGGGAYNDYLVYRIDNLLPQLKIMSTSEVGILPTLVEPIAFAWLAKKRIEQHVFTMQPITGAKKPCLLGVVYQP